MLINCNSCQKKFVVPDSAITESGRVVQCGSCGNKWTQHPIKEKTLNREINTKGVELDERKKIKINKFPKKTRPKKNLYTSEYLRKKHGLVIKDNINQNDSKSSNNIKNKNSFGFYSYVVFLFMFLILAFGILNLTKEMIILKYPSSEAYIYYFYEVIEIVSISFTEFINQYKN